MMKVILLISVCIEIIGCSHSGESINLLEQILKTQNSGILDTVLGDPERYRLQILYTQIDRDQDNNPRLTSYSYRINRKEYFYPASTVKLPVALLALEELNNRQIDGLNSETVMLTDSAIDGQTAVLSDSTSRNNMPSVGHYIKKIFLASDNDAFNRLYEFLGQENINQRLKAKGYANARIIHRLSLEATDQQNAATNPVRFLQNDQVIYHKPLETSSTSYRPTGTIELGIGEIIDGQLVKKPKDFASKNQISLKNLHETLIRVILPQLFKEDQRFRLTEADRSLLYQYLSQYPSESEFPDYDPAIYNDGYVKFFMFGDSKEPIPPNIRIFNKVGNAYGFIIDNAYIVDFTSQIEFFLSAVVYINQNQIFNDDHYEYNEIGYPFLAELGKAIYRHELVRQRDHLPNLSDFQRTYD